MKHQIKKCKGLNIDLCKSCKRQDNKEKVPLVKFIRTNPNTNKEYCNYYV